MTWRRGLLAMGVVSLVAQCIGLYSPVGGPSAPGLPIDKLAHAISFAVPVALFLLARVDWRIVLGAAVAQAVLSEVVQALLLPERSGDPLDVVADLVGTAIGAALAAMVRAIRRPRPTAG